MGDLVRIDGYGDRIFEVISVSRTHYKDASVEYEVTEYETLGVDDKRNYHADGEEITIVKKSDKKETDEPASIDDLLDELNAANKMIAMLGDDYAHERDAIVERLKEAVKHAQKERNGRWA